MTESVEATVCSDAKVYRLTVPIHQLYLWNWTFLYCLMKCTNVHTVWWCLLLKSVCCCEGERIMHPLQESGDKIKCINEPVCLNVWVLQEAYFQLGENFFGKKTFACRSGPVKGTETRQRWNHKMVEKRDKKITLICSTYHQVCGTDVG